MDMDSRINATALKEFDRTISQEMRQEGFRFLYNVIAGRRLCVAYRREGEDTVCYYTFRNRTDPFSRPVARHILYTRIDNQEPLRFKCPFNALQLEKEILLALEKKANTNPKGFPQDLLREFRDTESFGKYMEMTFGE